jgi:hypothetical protein
MGNSTWRPRSPDRLADEEWFAALTRVRGEFAEMPCIRVTREQARSLLGLPEPASSWVLGRLIAEGFLTQTPQGEYMRAGST